MSESWSPAERRAWKWPDAVLPSRWAEEHRILPAHVTAEPGPWRGERTPYLAGMCDALFEGNVEEIIVLKAAQVGFSEMLRNVMGYWIDVDPGPCLVVMPDQKSAEELIEERVKPLLEHTPAVARHVTARAWDVKKSSIRLDTMSIYVGWAGSSQAMKSRPIRYLLLEEPDEYVRVSGAAGDPISKAKKRITTYAAKGRARVIMGGTPTTRNNNMHRAWEACQDKRHFWVPCPSCGQYQRLVWKQVKYLPAEKGESPAQHAGRLIEERHGGAWYECEHKACAARWTSEMRDQAVRRGIWAGEDQVVTPDGRVVGPASRARVVGFHLSAIYSPWVRLEKLSAEWLESKDDPEKLCDFINQRLAEPFEEVIRRPRDSVLLEKVSRSAPPGIVGKEAVALFATADTQKDHFVYKIRWWGYDHRSGLVATGIAPTFEELYRICLKTIYRRADLNERGWVPSHLLIDSAGSNGDSKRTDEVYAFTLRDPARIVPTKGASHAQSRPIVESAQPNGVLLRMIDTGYFKDILAALMNDPQDKWLPHSQVDQDYCKQMASEHKIMDRKRGMIWTKVSQGAANHDWDGEVLQCVAYYMLNLHAAIETPAPEPETPPKLVTTPDGRPFMINQR